MSEPTPTVKVEVQVSHLRIGGHEFHPDEVTYRRGDELTLPENYAVRLGTSVRIILAPEPAEPEEEPETEPSTAVMVDLETLNAENVKKIIEDTDDREVLEAFHEQEEAGKNRKTVTDAIIAKINSL